MGRIDDAADRPSPTTRSMRIWDALEPEPPEPTDEALAELEAAGVDLDPLPPAERAARRTAGADEADAPAGFHRHGDVVHPSDHVHPHRRSEPGERPFIGIVGAGPVGTALGVALARAGWPVVAVASRDPGPAGPLRRARRWGPRLRRGPGRPRRGRARRPLRPRRRGRRLWREASGCTAARRSSTPRAPSGPRSSSRPGRRGPRRGRSTPSSRSPRWSASVEALRGATDGDRGGPGPGGAAGRDGRGARGGAGAAAAGLAGGVPRGGRPGGGRARRPPRRDRRARAGRRSRRGRARSPSTAGSPSRRWRTSEPSGSRRR
ncbi:MAG: hypothetical protein KatS3mg065_0652 [Chloroflexota bacterium]|nr:MAG: hypothetical protein KatS3mg065_0652 [Chloroflexota bacterium]